MKLPQLHIRDLFWLVLVVAMGCGWWVDHLACGRQIDEVQTSKGTLRQELLHSYLESQRWQSRAIQLESELVSEGYTVKFDPGDFIHVTPPQ